MKAVYPKVSIVLPAYNADKTIGRAIDSILQQRYGEWELLIIDDGSTDDTNRIVKGYTGDPRVHLFAQDANVGVSASRNIGLDAAIGGYVAFLDADDYWLPEKLEVQVNFMQRYDLIVSATSYFREVEITKKRFIEKTMKSAGINEMLERNRMAHSTAMVKREVISNIRFEKTGHEDYVFWVRVLLHSQSRVRFIQRPLTVYTVRKGSVSANKIRSAVWHWKNLRQDFSLPFTSAAKFFLSYALNSIRMGRLTR